MRLAGLLLVVIAVMGGIGYWYYTDTQVRMGILRDNNAELKIGIQTNEDALTSLQADYDNAKAELSSLNEAYTSIRRQNQQLADKLQRAVNRGTENAGRCFELLSGSPLTEKEKNAENEIAFNKECPWLWTGPSPDSMLNTPTSN